MKKIFVLLSLLAIGIYVSAQNPTVIQGSSAVTNMAGSSTAATSDSIEVGKANTYQIINGEYDWSLQIIPVQYGTLTSDSVYATVALFVSNKDNDNEWTEIRSIVADVTSTSPTPTIGHYYAYRDTIANTTVALTPGILMSGKDFEYKRMKLMVYRPATTDSVGYKVNYVLKLNQDQAR
jgi:hypothetical protein